MANSQRYARGAAKMKELFGAEPRPGMMHPDFQEITVEHLFGDIWTRPGLELRERSLVYAATAPIDPLSGDARRKEGASAQTESRTERKTIITRALLGSDAGLYGAARVAVSAG